MNISTYRIDASDNTGGDKIEQLGWPLFGKEKFPNYQLLWQAYVVPRTNRPEDIHFRSEVPLLERDVAAVHYAIYHSFYVIYDWLREASEAEKREKRSFEYSFIKLSNICDLTEEFLFKLLLFTGKLDAHNPLLKAATKKENLDAVATQIIELTADKILAELKERGTTTVVVLSRVKLLQSKFDLDTYLTLSQKIRNYRNIIIHSSHSFQINDKVPRIDTIKKEDWLSVTDTVKSNDDGAKQKMLRDFVPMRELITELADSLSNTVNQLWDEVLPLIPEYVHGK